MIYLGDGWVFVEHGEPVPIDCVACDHFFQSGIGSSICYCPKCGAFNDAGKIERIEVIIMPLLLEAIDLE